MNCLNVNKRPSKRKHLHLLSDRPGKTKVIMYMLIC